MENTEQGEQVPVTVKPTNQATDSNGDPTNVVDAATDPNHTISTVEAYAVENLPAVSAVVGDLSHVKTGYKTSEFWITLGTNAVTLLGGVLPQNSVWVRCVSGAVAGISTLAYIWGRVTVKKHASYANAAAAVATAPVL
jgi:hypothetical protein